MKCFSSNKGTHATRGGFTILESTLALSILVVAMAWVVQVGVESQRERSRNAARRDALETAANVLEAARARSWETLTPEWAANEMLPQAVAERLPGGRLTVRVEAEAERLLTKRVTVTIHWLSAEGKQARPVELVGFFSDRSARVAGGKS
jgi:type II secretory pathway pseudopilin PulG